MSNPFSFTYDESQASSGYDMIEKGEYECFISNVEIKTFQTGNTGLAVTLTIRDDLPQKFGKRKLWQNLVPTEKGMFMFHTFAKATQQPPGFQVSSLEQFKAAIETKPIRISVTHKNQRNQDGTYEMRETIAAFKQSTVGGTFVAPPSGNSFADPFAGQSSAPITISDDDLPF